MPTPPYDNPLTAEEVETFVDACNEMEEDSCNDEDAQSIGEAVGNGLGAGALNRLKLLLLYIKMHPG